MLLDLLFGPRRKAYTPAHGRGDGWSVIGGGRKTQAGTVVTEDLALTYSALWCGVRAIAETTAMLPLKLFRKDANGDRQEARDHPLYDLMKCRPNPDMGSMAFREGRTVHQIMWGQGFAEIERANPADDASPILAIWPIHPGRVRAATKSDVDARGRNLLEQGYRYVVTNNDHSKSPFKPSELLHLPGVLTEDGVWGKGVVAYARESIGFALGVERHGSTFFGSGAQPKGVLTTPGMQDSEKRKQFRAEWKTLHGSPDSGEIAILPPEAKYTSITMSNEDSQFLQTRVHNLDDMARWLRCPPHILMNLAKATNNNIEHQGLEFVIYCLLPWLIRAESQYDLKLLTAEERSAGYFFEHQLQGLLRGDAKTRTEAYTSAIASGIMTLNEVRRLENLNGIGPAGDQNLVQLNMTTWERVLAGPAPAGASGAVSAGQSAGEASPAPADALPPALLDVPEKLQSGNYDCGAACTHMVAEFWDVDNGREQSDYIDELGTTTEDGTSPDAIVDWFHGAGLVCTSGGGMTVEDLERAFREGKPVICPIQSPDDPASGVDGGHYVVVTGVGLGLVFFNDPVAGRSMMDVEEWDQRWHDVEADGGRADHFGIIMADGFPGGEKEEEEEEEELDDVEVVEDEEGEPAAALPVERNGAT